MKKHNNAKVLVENSERFFCLRTSSTYDKQKVAFEMCCFIKGRQQQKKKGKVNDVYYSLETLSHTFMTEESLCAFVKICGVYDERREQK